MKRTPTGKISIGISWAIFFIGIIAGLYFWYSNLLKTGALILIAGIVLAAILRLLVNINEFLFNLNKNTVSFQTMKVMEQNLREINCDSRDINENLYKLTSFLEEIQKYLHLKK